MTHEEFAAVVADLAQRLGAGRWDVRASGTRVEVASAGRRHIFPTDLAFLGYRTSASADGQRAAVERAAARILYILATDGEGEPYLQDWDWVRPRVHLRLFSAVHELPEACPPAHRPWLPGLAVGYLIEDADRGRLIAVTEAMAEGWGAAEPELFELGLARLSAAGTPLERVSRSAEIFGFCCGEAAASLGAVQILLPQQMERAAQACGSEDLLVGIPEVQTGVVCARGGPAPARLRGISALMHADASVPLIADPLRWTAGRWSRVSALDG